MTPLHNIAMAIGVELSTWKLELSEPLRSGGTWLLGAEHDGREVSVEWTEGKGFGVSLMREDAGYGEHPDAFFKEETEALAHALKMLRGEVT